MAVRIRLRRMGAKKRPFYRLVAAHSTSPRDGRFIETLGYYDPLTEPSTIQVNEEKTLLWLSRGAQMSESAENLLKRQGILQKFQEQKAAQKAARTSAAGEGQPAG